ncbi:hypothetical protein ABZ419_11165 [Streptomyces cinnamoneus]|uniref:hypothetical protein n=1 Tax=Streptomyces cinnamoneus TaxID=53446 RepID=UPI0033DD4754
MRAQPHPLAGRTVALRPGSVSPSLVVEDWAEHVFGKSWTAMGCHAASMAYAVRATVAGLPLDDDVVYGKCPAGLGHIVHVTEIDGGAS